MAARHNRANSAASFGSELAQGGQPVHSGTSSSTSLIYRVNLSASFCGKLTQGESNCLHDVSFQLAK
jgi:hypothetical protein